ncbi:hypothetical protein GGF50DRAFT_86542 [Schizophyllum commune]
MSNQANPSIYHPLDALHVFNLQDAIIQIGVELVFYTRHRPPTELLFRFNIVLVAARRCIYLLSDAIVVWRAWVLWPNSRVAKAILSTCMCGSVGQYYRRDIKGSLGLYTRKSQVETVLVLLVESGCLYSLLWAVYLAFLLTAGTGGSTVTNYVGTAIHSISGIHPTVVVLVVMHAATAESMIDTAHVSHALQFADTPEPQSRQSWHNDTQS